jgi:hypothetical protein
MITLSAARCRLLTPQAQRASTPSSRFVSAVALWGLCRERTERHAFHRIDRTIDAWWLARLRVSTAAAMAACGRMLGITILAS